MHESVRVQKLDANNDLCHEKLDLLFIESPTMLTHTMYIAAPDERHHVVEARLRLEAVVHRAQERMIALEEHLLLNMDRLDCVSVLRELVFTDALDGKFLASLLQRAQVDPAEGTLTDDVGHYKI